MLKQAFKTIKLVKEIKNLHSKDEYLKEKASHYLSDLAQKEGGLFHKLLQIEANKKDASDSIQNYQGSIDFAVDVDFVKKNFEEIFEHKFDDVFEWIDPNPILASIGQVHKARLKSGRIVAIKMQYPEIRNEIQKQLKALNIISGLSSFSPLKKWKMDVTSYYDMLCSLIEHELNYAHEIMLLDRIHHLRSEDTNIIFPKVDAYYRSPSFYVQDYIQGMNHDEVLAVDEKQKVFYAELLLESFLSLLFSTHFLQVDSNHTNYLFSENSLGLIDFGQGEFIDPQISRAICGLYLAMVQDKDIDLLPYFYAMGFSADKLIYIQDAIPLLTRELLYPFLCDYAMPVSDWKYKEHIDLILGDNKWWFRSAGGIEFFKIMKSFLGIVALIDKFNVSIQWKKVINNVIEKLPEEELNFKSDIKSPIPVSVKLLAKKLMIEVKRNGVTKVKLGLPSIAILSLEEYLEDDVKEKLRVRHIDVRKIIQLKLSKGGKPGNIFSLEENENHYRIWLE